MNTAEVLEIDPVNEVTTLALSIPDQAKQISIKSHADYARAGEIILTIKAIRKKITDTFKPIKQKMDAAKKEVLNQEQAADAPLKEAEAWLSPQIITWNQEQERIRQEEERKLREEARKREEEARLQAAVEAEQAGQSEVAEDIMEAPVYVPPVVLPKATPKVAGMSIRENWKFRIVNESLLPREFLSPDPVKIGAVVRSQKGSARIPGVEVWNEGTIAGRR